MNNKKIIKDITISLSLANLCFIADWFRYLDFSTIYYFVKTTAYTNFFYAIIINVLTLAVMIFVIIRIIRRLGKSSGRFAEICFVFILIGPFLSLFIGKINEIIYRYMGEQNVLKISIGIILLSTVIFLIIKYHVLYSKIGLNVVLILFPFIFFTFSFSLWQLIKTDPAIFTDKPNANLIKPSEPGPRVCLIVFDEAGQGLMFDKRPESVSLPEFDRFKKQAIYMSNAMPPGKSTILSMPSIITGKILSKATPASPDEMLLTIKDSGETVGWSHMPNIFSRARELGINTALVGWYHPYGRVLNNSLVNCFWMPGDQYRNVSIIEFMYEQERNLLDAYLSLINLRLPSYLYRTEEIMQQKERKNTYSILMDEAKKTVSNPDFRLILIHLPVPHPPGFYDRDKNEFSSEGNSYLDNLALADNSLRELRVSMEKAGVWEGTNVIITSDHWWRAYFWRTRYFWSDEDENLYKAGLDYRVPLLIKLNGQKETINYEKEINTVLVHDLIISLLNNQLVRPDDVVNWIDKTRTYLKEPDYNRQIDDL